MNFDWTKLAFANKKPVKDLQAIFIAAPRELSVARLKQLIHEYLPQGNILLGIAKEEYVDGFDGQPQFRTLQLKHKSIAPFIKHVNAQKLNHAIYTLAYFQRELTPILQKLKPRRVVLVRGSWQHAFHIRPEYYELADRSIPYDIVSPFASDDEAKAYEEKLKGEFLERLTPEKGETYTARSMLELARSVARASYDYSFQTGAVLGRRVPDMQRYECLTYGFNKVVPYQTYALHHGASREDNFSPPNDLNHYDTIHAEVKLLINAQRKKLDLRNTTLFINLMPCPTCARMLAETDIAEVVYSLDHSDGYGVRMLETAGKKVRRLVI